MSVANNFRQWTLDNGLRVLVEHHAHMRSASVGFFAKAGSRDESPEVNGVSHFLEHMMFKGTHKRSGFEVDETFDRLGAEYNAFTGYEYTGYYGRVLPEHMAELLELMADLMRPVLRQDDFEMEKKVILEEIALYEDQPGSVLQRQAIQSYYGKHPLGQEILGATEVIQALSRDQMQHYFDAKYSPGNLILCVVGNVSPEELSELANHHCGSWTPGNSTRLYPDLQFDAHTLALTKSNVSRQYGVMLSPAPAYQDARNEAMDLLIDVLGHPGNSRLHWALVDKGLVDYAGASYQAQDGTGMAGVSFSCDPEKTSGVQDVITSEIERLIEDGVQPEELESARNRVLTSLATEGEQSLRRMMSVSFNALYDTPYQDQAAALEAYKKVSLDDLHALLTEFPFAPRTVATMGPDTR